MIISASTQLGRISVAGTILPATVVQALETAHKVAGYSTPDAVRDAPRVVADAIAAGRDPYTDKAVTAAVIAVEVAKYHRAAADYAWADATAVVAANADEVVAAWRPSFTAAAQDLESAVPTIGRWGHDDDEVSAVLNSGGDAAARWLMVKAALGTIGNIIHAWKALAELCHRSGGYRADNLGIVADLTHPQWLKVTETAAKPTAMDRTGTKHLNAWDVARAGYPLSLATFGEYTARMDRRRPPELAPLPPRDRVIRTKAENDAMIARLRPEAHDLAANEKV